MNSVWKKTAMVALAGVFVLTAAGCGGGDKKAAGNETLKVGVMNEADGLEPADPDGGRALLRYGLGETLVKFDNNMKTAPWLAESWKMDGDRLTWTFIINSKATFSNGKKVTAEAVKASLERTLAKSAEAKGWAMIESMQADGQRLTIRTKKPLPGLPGVLCDPRFTVTDTSVTDRDMQKMGPVCTGPYMVKSVSGNRTALEANPHYWNGPVPFKSVELVSMDDPGARAMALKKGEVDAATAVSSGDLALFKDAQQYCVSETPSVSSVLTRLNVRQGRALADKRIREALAVCLDRPAWCKVLLKDTFIPGGPALAPGLGYGYEELIRSEYCRFDPEKAKKLLAEAGYKKDANRDGILDKDGKNLEIDFTFYTSRGELPLFAEAVKSDAKRIGIRINLKPVGYADWKRAAKTGEYDMLLDYGMTVEAGSPLHYLDSCWKTDTKGSNPQNVSGYSNPEYDALSDALALETDPVKQKQGLIAMQKALLKDTAAIVFGYPKANIVSRTGITGADAQLCDYYWITKDWKRKE